jgi:hypothetical protein
VPAATRRAAVDAILGMAVLSGGPVASR